MNMDARLSVEGLAVGHDAHAPLARNISLRLSGGETVVLVGPSGCGKTTLLRTLLGLERPLAGAATIAGAALPDRPARGAVGYIPQGLGLVRHASALRNVAMGTLPHTSSWRSLLGTFPAPAMTAARQALDVVGLAHKADAKPAHMSGGERRRVAIARALVQRPRILFADEILSELDVTTQRQVLDAVKLLQAETNMALLMVEHDLDMAWEVGDRVIVMRPGGVAAELTPRTGDASQLREVMVRA